MSQHDLVAHEPSTSLDALIGIDAIAKYMGMSHKQAAAHIWRGHLPTFRVGKIVCMRRSTLAEWIRRQETQAPSP